MKSDLILLEEFGEPLKPADELPPATVRHRVMNGMRHDRPRGPLLAHRVVTRPMGVRLAWRLGAPAAVAGIIAAGLIVGNMADIAGNAPAPPATEAGTGANPAPDVGSVLRLAAQYAEGTQLLDARDDQFVYIESMEVRTQLYGKDFDEKRTVGPVRVRTWLSVDGTRDGLVTDDLDANTRLSGCIDGLQAETIDRPDTTPKVPCTPEPAYRRAAVPTDPDELLAYVYQHSTPQPRGGCEPLVDQVSRNEFGSGCVISSEHRRAFMTLTELLHQNHSPAVQAAIFRAAARIPGVELKSGVVDAAGRTGVAVTRTEVGTRDELVFDRQTYAFLGHNAIVAEFDPATAQIAGGGQADPAAIERLKRRGNPGDPILKWAVLAIDIVDRAGQRP
jgi:hypothetical protein